MKIVCTLEEYSRMVRMCQRGMDSNDCKGCALLNICSNNMLEDAVQFDIVDHEELDIEYITCERTD